MMDALVGPHADTWRAPLFLKYLSGRIGKAEARRVAAFVEAWIVASESVGHSATAVEFAAHWGVGEATAYRELRAFKTAFPSEATPERLAWLIGWARTPWIDYEEFSRVHQEVLGLDVTAIDQIWAGREFVEALDEVGR